MKIFSPILIFLFLSICGSICAQQSPTRGTTPNPPQFVSAAQFASLPAELQAIISVNPQRFIVEGKTILRDKPSLELDPSLGKKQTDTQTNSSPILLEHSPALSPIAKHRISRTEMQSMSAEKQAHINANLDKYEIVD